MGWDQRPGNNRSRRHHNSAATRSAHGRLRHAEIDGGTDHWRKSKPTSTAARLPPPSEGWNEEPRPAMIRSPSPGIRGNPGIASAWVPGPAAIHERVPPSTHKIRLPQPSVSRRIIKISVVVEITDTISIGRVVVVLAQIGIVIFVLFFVPSIKGSVFQLGSLVLIVVGQIKSNRLVLSHFHAARSAFNFHIAF